MIPVAEITKWWGNHPGPIGSLFDEVRKAIEPVLSKPNRKQGPDVLTPRVEKPFKVESNWFHGSCTLPTYRLEELLGTKMRALYQRNKGRDLFDLWMGLTLGNANPAGIIECFKKYMEAENQSVSGKNYRQNLESKIKDSRFLSDVSPLIRSDNEYDAGTAMELVMELLVHAL